MESLKSPVIRTVWYCLWLLLVLVSQKWEHFCLTKTGLNYLNVVLFIIGSIIILSLMVKRYRHENSAFIDEKQSLWCGIGEYFSLILFTILVIGIFLTVISYLKAHGRFPYLVGDTDYLDRGKAAFWFDLVASGLIISVEQQFVTTGFLFNYFWRKPKISSAILGIISSGLIFGLLNMEIAHLINFFIYFIIGCLLATIYLATHNFKISIMLGIFVALLRVILI